MRATMAIAAAAAWFGSAGAALAESGLGQPAPWQLGLQKAASPIMEEITVLHDFLLIVITVISVFVLALLVWVAIKFNAKANPEPSKTTHHTGLEIAWTVIPVLILLVIAVPSFRLLYFDRTIPPADITIKTIGNQWYWSYEYPDHGDVSFDQTLLEGEDQYVAGAIEGAHATIVLGPDNQVL